MDTNRNLNPKGRCGLAGKHIRIECSGDKIGIFVGERGIVEKCTSVQKEMIG